MSFTPSWDVLSKYAHVLINFALNSGKGVKQGEVVQCLVPDVAKPILLPLQNTILKAGAHPLLRLLPTGLSRDFYKLASDQQLTFFPKRYIKSRVDLIDHSVGIIAEHDLHELKHTDPKKIVKAAESRKKARDWLNHKEYDGRFTWTLALYGTPAMAKEAGLNLKTYWDQIIRACFLDKTDPVGEWQKIFKEQERVKKALNSLPTQKLHLVAKDTDLWLTFGEKRKWVGGSGRNIPSFEIFTSPDWRGTEGFVSFNQPLYRYGNIIKEVRLEFQKGKVTKATSKTGQNLLREMIKRKNADKIGEYSLTDSRASRITKFMANTLYDENVGGKYGNTHLAVGMSYKDTFAGDPRTLKKPLMKKLGYNDSGEHCDIVSTTNRTVSAILKNGKEKIIYQDGKFTV